MNPWIDVAIRSTAMLAAGVLFDILFRSRAAALRHFVLAASIVAAVGVMPLSFVVPTLNVPIEPRWDKTTALVSSAVSTVDDEQSADARRAPVRPAADSTPVADPPSVAAVLWITGFGVALAS